VTDLVPWNLVLVWAAIAWMRGARADLGERFLHVWWIVIAAVFSAAYGKRDIYLLPAYPAIAILAGRALAAATANAAATRLFAVVPISERFRRGSGALPARSLLVLVVVILDVTLLTVSEVTRFHQVRRRSLLTFTRVVDAELPADAAVYALNDVDGSDVQVLAYRLRRVVPSVPAVPLDDADAATTYYFVGAQADRSMDPRFHVVAQSSRRGPNVALVIVPR
jgi:4-amino-4-deoxy-L-arabinose transferase-like glycosyltransferase